MYKIEEVGPFIEEWKPIPGYEFYEVSNYGRIKSLKRIVKRGNNFLPVRERILKQGVNPGGYKICDLYVNGNKKTSRIHQLVSIAFLNHKPCGMKLVVDHKNNIKTDNFYLNIQIITNRKNLSKDKRLGSSKYTCVHSCNTKNKWVSKIHIKGKSKYLGNFDSESKANEAYRNRLKQIVD